MEASNGAPGRAAAPALGRSVTRSAAAQAGTTTPTQPAAGLDPMDPLALSAATAPDPLPAPPPPGGSGVAAAGPKKLAPEPPQPVVPPAVGRAKRNRPNVKYSPARTGKVAPRRIGATAASSSTRPPSAQAETFPQNGEYCAVCGAAGLYVCCDGCPRVFHPLCVDPPLLGVEETSDHWFCRECTVAKAPPVPPPSSLFSKLILKTELENPRTFRLPRSLRTAFDQVASHPQTGDYVDESRLKPKPKLDAKGYAEEPDPYRTRTKDGRTILCFQCGQAASAAKKKRIIGCDSCEQFFHLDCLDPPLAAPPPDSWKWTCPLHSEKAMPKKRLPKQSVLARVDKPNMANNGDIDVIPRLELRRGSRHVEEITHNRLRFQVPEEIITLDFWAKVKGQHKRQPLPSELAPVEEETMGVVTGESSPLTPLSSLETTPEPPMGDTDISSRDSSPAVGSSRRRRSILAPNLRLSASETGGSSLRGTRSSSRLVRNPSGLSSTSAPAVDPETRLTLDDLANIALEQERTAEADSGLTRGRAPKRIRIKGTKYLAVDTAAATDDERSTAVDPSSRPSPLPAIAGINGMGNGKGKARESNGFSAASDASESGAMAPLQQSVTGSVAVSPSPAPSNLRDGEDALPSGLAHNEADIQALLRVRKLLLDDGANRTELLKYLGPVAASDASPSEHAPTVDGPVHLAAPTLERRQSRRTSSRAQSSQPMDIDEPSPGLGE